jgi:phenylacetate-CoA ligase
MSTGTTPAVTPPPRHDELRARHTAEAMAAAPELVGRLEWSAERLAEHRLGELRRLVRVARDLSPWHRRRLAGVDPEEIDETTLGRLPVMTKDDLMEHFDEIVTDDRLRLPVVEEHLAGPAAGAYLYGRYHACASGGSSGRRGVFVYDNDAWTTAYWAAMRLAVRGMRRYPELAAAMRRPVLVAAAVRTHLSAGLMRTFDDPDSPWQFAPVTLPVAEQVAMLNDIRPTTLVGFASALRLLVGEARAGRLRICPDYVGSTSEPLDPQLRADLAECFGARVGNTYGTSEGAFADYCGHPDSPWMHLADDLVIVEPVDAAGAPVGAGVSSDKIFLTNLYNHALPLIRYEITDEVTVLDGPCGCGCAHRRIADPQGRLDDVFDYGGVVVHPHVFRSVLARHRAVVEYQVRQTTDGVAVHVVAGAAPDLPVLEREIAAALAAAGVPGASVEVRAVDGLERAPSGKLSRFRALPRVP